jgi:hypothetical protein
MTISEICAYGHHGLFTACPPFNAMNSRFFQNLQAGSFALQQQLIATGCEASVAAAGLPL